MLNDPSSFILMKAAPISTSGIELPCIRQHMPRPRFLVPVPCLPYFFVQPMSFIPSVIHSLRPHETDRHIYPGAAFPKALKIGEVFTLPNMIFLAEFDRIHADGFSHLIHLAFHGESGLGGAITTICACYRQVGINGVADKFDVFQCDIAAEPSIRSC